MSSTVTVALQADDIEPWLRQAADDAARYSSLADHIGRATYHAPLGHGESYEDARARWQRAFLKARRIVQAFGVDYEPVSEEETLTITFDEIGGRTKVMRLPGLGPVGWRTGGRPDYRHPRPCYRGGVHHAACNAAADRVIRRWRAGL